MFTLDQVTLFQPPATREVFGLPDDGTGNAVLFDVQDFIGRLDIDAAYEAGFLHEGVRLATCDQTVLQVIQQMGIPWCAWPQEGFTLVVLEHARMGVLADRLVIASLEARERK